MSQSPQIRGFKKAICKPKPKLAKTTVNNYNEITVVQPFDHSNRKRISQKDTKLKVDQYGSKESLKNEHRIRRTTHSDDNLDLLELEEINFPLTKPVQVRKKTGRKSFKATKSIASAVAAGHLIKVSN